METETFCFVANQLNLSIHFTSRGGLERMLRPVKDEDSPINTESGQNVWVLRLVSSLVDLTGMLNLLDNVTLNGSNVS